MWYSAIDFVEPFWLVHLYLEKTNKQLFIWDYIITDIIALQFKFVLNLVFTTYLFPCCYRYKCRASSRSVPVCVSAVCNHHPGSVPPLHEVGWREEEQSSPCHSEGFSQCAHVRFQ